MPHYSRAMTKYRFVTPHRVGKWYPDLSHAQRFANTIGAGFLDPRSGRFIAYPGTRLETAAVPVSPAKVVPPETCRELR